MFSSAEDHRRLIYLRHTKMNNIWIAVMTKPKHISKPVAFSRRLINIEGLLPTGKACFGTRLALLRRVQDMGGRASHLGRISQWTQRFPRFQCHSTSRFYIGDLRCQSAENCYIHRIPVARPCIFHANEHNISPQCVPCHPCPVCYDS